MGHFVWSGCNELFVLKTIKILKIFGMPLVFQIIAPLCTGLMMSMLMTIFSNSNSTDKKVACSTMLKYDQSTYKYETQGTSYKSIYTTTHIISLKGL